MKIITEFQEKPVIDVVMKYVMDNLRHISDPDFGANVAKLAVDEVKKTLTIKIGEDTVHLFREE